MIAYLRGLDGGSSARGGEEPLAQTPIELGIAIW